MGKGPLTVCSSASRLLSSHFLPSNFHFSSQWLHFIPELTVLHSPCHASSRCLWKPSYIEQHLFHAKYWPMDIIYIILTDWTSSLHAASSQAFFQTKLMCPPSRKWLLIPTAIPAPRRLRLEPLPLLPGGPLWLPVSRHLWHYPSHMYNLKQF